MTPRTTKESQPIVARGRDVPPSIPAGALSASERRRWHRHRVDRDALANVAARRDAEFQSAMFPPSRQRGRTYRLYCGNSSCPTRAAGQPHEVAASDLVDGTVWLCSICRASVLPQPSGRQPRRERKAVCEACGEWFVAVRSDARYCGDTCRVRARRRATLTTPALARRARRRDPLTSRLVRADEFRGQAPLPGLSADISTLSDQGFCDAERGRR